MEIQCTRLRQHDFVKEQGNNASAMSSIDDMFGAIALPLTKDELITRNTTILYVGAGETPALTALLFNFNACRVLSYDPAAEMCREESATVNRQLMKRFLAVEKVKEAEVIGIIAGTLGVGMRMCDGDRVSSS